MNTYKIDEVKKLTIEEALNTVMLSELIKLQGKDVVTCKA